MNRTTASVLSFAFAAAAVCAAPVQWDIAALKKTPRVFAAPGGVEVPAGVTAVCFEGLPWRDQPTRVFAYYGLPASASPEHKVPGIVLVHGAGGTAFARWVKAWNERGYAAIAFDDEGQLPVGKYNAWTRLPDGGPRRADIPQLGWPVADQWMYHAIADTMLAHSLLVSLPGVDADRIGASGISWGGVVVSSVAGIDPRLKFAVPIYGCGFISEESDDGSTFVGSKATSGQRAAWRALWDPARYLPAAKIPMLWLAGANDFAFTPKARQQSYRASPGPRLLSLPVQMPHCHGAISEEADIVRAFADQVVGGSPALVKITGQQTRGNVAMVSCLTTSPLIRAEFNYTVDHARWQDRKWATLPATIQGDRASAEIPAGTTAYYFNLIDDRGLIVSSEHEERTP